MPLHASTRAGATEDAGDSTQLNLTQPAVIRAAAWSRRDWLAVCIGTLALVPGAGAQSIPAGPLRFPGDHGSHPELRTEWWYLTGYAQTGERSFGFQLTFFRSRVPGTQALRSQFAARQLIFAHAALTDVQGSRLLHDQRIARAGFGLAEASEKDTDVVLGSWSLKRTEAAGRSRYSARMQGDAFALELELEATQSVLLQGDGGLSRKGPHADNLSYYITEPQLRAHGTITLGRERLDVEPAAARAWLDHEASEAILPEEAVGWDWIGMNLQDGSALTAFQLRRADGSALWVGGSWRTPDSAVQNFAVGELRFTPLRTWSSGTSGARYPVAWRLDTPAGVFEVHALLDAQELDSRASTGAFYWEGLSELRGRDGSPVGRGYLEMTGYAARLAM